MSSLGESKMPLGQRVAEFSEVMASTRLSSVDGKALELEVGNDQVMAAIRQLREQKGSLYIVGNGGSAAVASHAVIDFLNVGKLRAAVIHDPSQMTCMANDFGYENAYACMLSILARPGDMLVAISSSGRSQNIVNAVKTFKEAGGDGHYPQWFCAG